MTISINYLVHSCQH